VAEAELPRDFRVLLRPPRIAWPTVVLFLVCMAGLTGVSVLAVSRQIPLAAGCIVNGVIVYFLFSVVHDASHRAVSEVGWLNEAIGRIGLFFFGPLAPFDFARWIHMQHHRFTNDARKDPDHFGHTMDLFTPLRWLNFDYYYTRFFLQQAGDVRSKYAGRVIAQALLIVGLLAAAAYAGYLLEALLLWIVPTRISSFLFVAMFVYLPHAPFSHTSQEDEYKASNIRAGWEWLLTPLMAYQNYHLVHHLYPRAPFYRMLKIWNARLDQHLANEPYFVKTFGVSARELQSNAL
jgi:fatty acid desaturase